MRLFYFVIGFLALGLGMIGIVIPGLPTTPLILLASVCFAKSSVKFDKWLKSTKIYKKYAEEFVKTGKMRKKEKIIIQIFANICMLLVLLLVSILFVRILVLIGLIVHNYVFFFKIESK